ncbi:MAG: VWA domain-containing protein [Xenococcaceae cyanobacterium]
MKNDLNHVDLCFVVDTTGSMGSFIATAQQQLLNTISLLSADSNIDLQVGLVEYRDHPPQDRSFITRIYPLTNNLKQMQKNINKLQANGGGDMAEAVYRGVYDACEKMKWRKHSCRFIMLVGDAPPHGFSVWLQEMTGNRVSRGSDTWPNGCPSGLNVQSVAAAAENQRVKIYALCMGNYNLTREAFTAIATTTGGQCAAANSASEIISQIVAVLKNEFSYLKFDRQVLQTIQQLGKLDVSEIANALDCPQLPTAASIARLGKRGFLQEFLLV